VRFKPFHDERTPVPSELVHLAVAGLVAASLLGPTFDRRSVTVVLAAAAVPDLDTFVGLVVPGAHRALLHTLVLPALVGVVLTQQSRRPDSWLRRRYGARGVRVAWVALASLLFAGIAPDLFTNGVNAFYPLHDTFYRVNGELLLSNQRGVVQTFVELGQAPERTTENTHYWTGVDPTPGDEPANVERIFPVVESGIQLMLVVLSATVLTVRLVVDGRR
jgi:membrane-bound metal-dependent hydrolase YbcI (DUF457 family)